MFKRFHDVDKWEKEWYLALSAPEKIAWDYITSKCDNVGVWTPNYKLAEYLIGEPIDWKAFATKCNGNIQILDNGKWWIVDFCSFQYPELKEDSTCRPHQSYIALLKKHGLWEAYLYGIYTVQDKEQDKDMDKDKDKDKGKDKDCRKKAFFVKPSLDEVQAYCDERANGIKAHAFIDYYDSVGWMVGKKPMRDWKACIRTWESKARPADTADLSKLNV